MKIMLVEYDAGWVKMFEGECGLLVGCLGDSVAGIEHVGSTAVVGLVSKPIIDIMVGLVDFSVADSLVSGIVNMGYTYFPEYEDVMPDRRFFKKSVNGTATHHVHMTEIDSKFWQRHLLFRDYLRVNPGTAEEYALLKKELAKREWEDSNDFATAKTEFIRRVEEQARKYA
ncbi:MAG TPA: GrpB family protein [Phycisphaerales bacterium]|nr:GrpB family protein [Phycisphaerales bacterium]